MHGDSLELANLVEDPFREVDLLNALLQCEISSHQTYTHVLSKLEGVPGLRQLARFEIDHEASAEALRQRIRSIGGSPVETAGVWGQWPQAISAADRVVGSVADLDALKQEEQQSAEEYRRVLALPRLSRDCRELILCSLLPRVELHLQLVNQLIEGDVPAVF